MHPFTLPTEELNRIKRIYSSANVFHSGIYDDDVWSSLLAFHSIMKNRLHQSYPIVMHYSSPLCEAVVLKIDPRSCMAYKGYDDYVEYVYRDTSGEICFLHTAEKYVDIKATISTALTRFGDDILDIFKGPYKSVTDFYEKEDFYIKISRKYWTVYRDSEKHNRDTNEKLNPLTIHDFYIRANLKWIKKAVLILKKKSVDDEQPNNPLEIVKAETICNEFASLVEDIQKVGSARPNRNELFDYNYVVAILNEDYPSLAERLKNFLKSDYKFTDDLVILKSTIADAYNTIV